MQRWDEMKYKIAQRLSFLVMVLAVVLITATTTKAQEVPKSSKWETTGLSKPYISALETTPYGILASEFDTRYWALPYNGIYFSSDGGHSWVEFGLKNYGVTDVKYANGKIYAATYYSTPSRPAGLYYTDNLGVTWHHLGNDLPSKSLGILGEKIFLGTANSGLWVSKDSGQIWKQELNPDDHITNVDNIFVSEEVIAIWSFRNLFLSYDKGKTWEKDIFIEAAESDVFLIDSNLLYVGTRYLGILVYKDFKTLWKEDCTFCDEEVLNLYKMGVNTYAAVRSNDPGLIEVYKSKNAGVSWEKTGFDTEAEATDFTDFTIKAGFPSYLLAAAPGKGVYRKEITFVREKDPFLGSLWIGQRPNELLQKISSFFDHAYPLLGYSFYSEPKQSSETTVNFLGYEGSEPEIYYSSHNGYDFALPYGTEITAPANGLASGIYCPDCGYSLIIEHPNGYRTIYMHLQKEGLYAQDWERDKPVNEGQVMGKVGMTGNTTGPHLHFGVLTPADDSDPWRYWGSWFFTDPFGWRNDYTYDPWTFYWWRDILGDHQGKPSKNLWKESSEISEITAAFKNTALSIDLENISIKIPSDVGGFPMTFSVREGARPVTKGLSYVEDTSIIVEAKNYLGNLIHNLDKYIEIKVNLAIGNLSNIDIESLAIYHWNEAKNIWEKLNSVLDPINLTLEAQANAISQFAVFGQLQNSQYPVTVVTLEGTMDGYWFTEYPLVTLTCTLNCDKTFYSITGEYWNEYTEPFLVEMEGITKLRYRSQGNYGLIEELNFEPLRINTRGTLHKTLPFLRSAVSIAETWD